MHCDLGARDIQGRWFHCILAWDDEEIKHLRKMTFKGQQQVCRSQLFHIPFTFINQPKGGTLEVVLLIVNPDIVKDTDIY